jgi:hypothetical protein
MGPSAIRLFFQQVTEDLDMIDRIDRHPTAKGIEAFDERNGEDRRKVPTMLDPDIDRRKEERRRNPFKKAANDR